MASYNFVSVYSDPFCRNFFIESGVNQDECQNQVGSIFRVFNRKKDNTKGISLKFTINFYHTTSTVLVNGNKVELFEKELFERICEGIKKQGTKLTVVNEQISMALSDIERKLGSCNIGTRSKVKSITGVNGNDCTDLMTDGIEIVKENSDADLGSMGNSLTNSDILVRSPGGTGEKVYQCPICEQIAGDDTIACEACEEWFHFACAGIDRSAANSIHGDVPYICLMCNDNQLYIDALDTQSVNGDQNVIIPLSDDEHSNILPQTSMSKDTDNSEQNNINMMENDHSEKTPKNNCNNSDTSVNPVDFGKKGKGKKGQNNAKKNGNVENQETLIAQKYYISSLEGKVNHLENLLKVMERTVENNNSQHSNESVPPNGSGNRSNHPSCAYLEQMNYKLLENRLCLLESQHQMWNNLHLQNQFQLQSMIKERFAPPHVPFMGLAPPYANPWMYPMMYGTPPGYVPLIQPQPVQIPQPHFMVPPSVPRQVHQMNIQAHVATPATGHLGLHPQVPTHSNHDTGRNVTVETNIPKSKPRQSLNHEPNHTRRKRQPHNGYASRQSQPEIKRQCSEESVIHVVEHGCSTAAVSSHEMPSHSTSGANEMPRGGPSKAHNLVEEIPCEANHRNIITVKPQSVQPELEENLNVTQSRVTSRSNNEYGGKVEHEQQDNDKQHTFLRIPSLEKAPPDLDSLETDLSWEMITTRL